MERLIEIFTDPGDVVIDPLAGSGVVLLAAANLRRKAFGFEIKKEFVRKATEEILSRKQPRLFENDIPKKPKQQELITKGGGGF
jgi:site-specific DNA-methyltransferase (adenine-specific)